MNHASLVKRVWSDAVWSKVIAAGIIALASGTYIWIISRVERVGSADVLARVLNIFSIRVPVWFILVALVLSPLLLALRSRLVRSRYITVRADDITGVKRHRITYPADSFNTVNQLIDRLLRDFEDEGLPEYDLGTDWIIVHPASRTEITKRSDKPLKSFGIKPGSEIELDMFPWSKSKNQRADTLAPPQPKPEPQLLRMYGLLWDKYQNPLCPADQTLLSHFMRHARGQYDILQCAKCHGRFPIHHDQMGNLPLARAKELIKDAIRDA